MRDGSAVVSQRSRWRQRQVGSGNTDLACTVVQHLAYGEGCAAGLVVLIDQPMAVGQRGGVDFQRARADLAAAVVQGKRAHAGAGTGRLAGGARVQRAVHVGQQRTGPDCQRSIRRHRAAVVAQRGRAQLHGLLRADGAAVDHGRGCDHDVAVGPDRPAVQLAFQVGQRATVDAEQAVSGMVDDAAIIDQLAGGYGKLAAVAFYRTVLVVEQSCVYVDCGVAGAGLADQAAVIGQAVARQSDLLAGHLAGRVGPGSAGSAGQQTVGQQLAVAVIQPVRRINSQGAGGADDAAIAHRAGRDRGGAVAADLAQRAAIGRSHADIGERACDRDTQTIRSHRRDAAMRVVQ